MPSCSARGRASTSGERGALVRVEGDFDWIAEVAWFILKDAKSCSAQYFHDFGRGRPLHRIATGKVVCWMEKKSCCGGYQHSIYTSSTCSIIRSAGSSPLSFM